MTRLAALLAALACLAHPAAAFAARESLGVYGEWAAFRDDSPARCYAIAKPRSASNTQPFASVATWPAQNIRGQLHIRLSRAVGEAASVTLVLGNRSFDLTASARDAWARDARMDAAILAAMRSATGMSVSARGANGQRFTDRYTLEGAATAMDASVVSCAQG